MKTWILYKRKNLLRKQEITFGIDMHEVEERIIMVPPGISKDVITFAPGQSPKDLAELVAKDSTVKINPDDTIMSLGKTVFIPNNNYMDVPVSPEEVREFYETYERITSS